MTKKITHALLVFTGLFIGGCVHKTEPGFHSGQGDVGAFVLTEAVRRGGTPIQTNNLPRIPGSWRYFEDENGVVIRLPTRSYIHVEEFVVTAFGPPKMGPSETTDGGKLATCIAERSQTVYIQR